MCKSKRNGMVQPAAVVCLAMGLLLMIRSGIQAQDRQPSTQGNQLRQQKRQDQFTGARINDGRPRFGFPGWKRPGRKRPPREPEPPRREIGLPEFVVVDQNTIKIRSEPGVPGVIKIRLAVGRNVQWWKGIKIRPSQPLSGDHDERALAPEQFISLQDSPGGVTRTATFQPDDMDNGGLVRIDFWKAKFLGVHTFMVRHSFSVEAMRGKLVTFTWIE